MTHSLFRPLSLLVLLLVAAGLPSCFVSSRSNVEVFNKNEYAQSVSVKTIKVPLLISRPILKKYLRYEEEVPKEITNLIGGIKKIRVTLAQTSNPRLISDFHTAMMAIPGEEWVSVNNGKQCLHLKVQQSDKAVIKRITVAVSAPEANQLVYVNMKCNLTPAQLSKLINFALNSEEGKKMLKEQEME